MHLYGSIAKSNYVFGGWYYKIPELWSPDQENIKTYPYLQLPEYEWGSIDKDLFEFYSLRLRNIDGAVLDLRTSKWKEKLLTFICWFGEKWQYKEGLISDSSPFDYVVYLGNNDILTSCGYKWVAFNKEVDEEKTIELWYYCDSVNSPEELYYIDKLDKKDF